MFHTKKNPKSNRVKFYCVYCEDARNLLIEGNRESEKGVDDVWIVVEFLMNHEGKDTHLCGTTIVELDSGSSLSFALRPT